MTSKPHSEWRDFLAQHPRVVPIYRKTGPHASGVDAFERARDIEAALDALPGLLEQYEGEKARAKWLQGVVDEGEATERRLKEQLETHDAMLRRVLRYLNGSRYLVGADGLAEDVEALLSNPASRPEGE